MQLGRKSHEQFGPYDLSYDIVGDVETSAAGNLIIRVGRTNVADERWEQVAHITLTPDEVQRFYDAIGAQGFRHRDTELVDLLGQYGDAKFGDEYWPGNPGPWLPREQAIRLAELTDSPIPEYDEDDEVIL